jgi:hypothetical protein
MRVRFLLFILFALLFAPLLSHAQVFSWREPGVSTCYKIDFVANHLFESNVKGQWVDLGEVNLVDIKSADLYSNADAINPIKN